MLEKLCRAKLDVRKGIAKNALPSWSDENEQLISAYGAAQVSRPLTEREATAFRNYTERLEGQCQWAGMNPIRCDDAGDIDIGAIKEAMIKVMGSRIPLEQLELAKSAKRAAELGREPNERESAAVEALDSEWKRLLQLAGKVS